MTPIDFPAPNIGPADHRARPQGPGGRPPRRGSRRRTFRRRRRRTGGGSTVETPGCDDAVAVVRTSGSTGTPKATVLTVEALAASSDGHGVCAQGRGPVAAGPPVQYVAGRAGAGAFAVRRHPAVGHGHVRRLHARGLHRGRPGADGQDPLHVPGAHPAAAAAGRDPTPETLAVLRRFNGDPAGRRARRSANCWTRPARPASAWSPPTVRRKPAAAASTTASRSRASLARVDEDGRILLGGDTMAAGYLGAPGRGPPTLSSRRTASAGTAPATSAPSTPTAGSPCWAAPTT